MSDETLKPCPFCGSNKVYPNIELGKHWVECRECTAESGCYRTEAEAIAAWNTRAAHGTLTAKQVREAIEHNFGKVAVIDDGGEKVEWREGWVCNVGFNSQAITDELNAKLGSGTCENKAKHWGEFECSECGFYADFGSDLHRVNRCPDCGKTVK